VTEHPRALVLPDGRIFVSQAGAAVPPALYETARRRLTWRGFGPGGPRAGPGMAFDPEFEPGNPRGWNGSSGT